MYLFHGSPNIIETPTFGLGSVHNDYGPGFYCTEDIEMAKEWACPTPRDGYANKYAFEADGLDLLDLTSGTWHVLNWLAILLENRTFDIANPLADEARDYIKSEFMPSYAEKDVIIGYRADDSYFSFAKAFLNGGISLQALSEAMRLGKLGRQICIKSRKAFEKLRFVEAFWAEGQDFYVKRHNRDEKARKDYLKLLAEGKDIRKDFYMIDILRQEWKNDDERLR